MSGNVRLGAQSPNLVISLNRTANDWSDLAMDGTFPRVGRLDGDHAGFWCHPIKLVDKFEFDVSDGYHKRAGGHSVEIFDWLRFLEFAKKHLKR